MAGSLVNSMFVCVCMNIMCAHTYIDTYASQQGSVYECMCIQVIFKKQGSLNYKN